MSEDGNVICDSTTHSLPGAHILSGAVLEPRALQELFPDWQDREVSVLTALSTTDTLDLSRPHSTRQL